MKKWWSTIIIAGITCLYLAGFFQYLYPKKEMATEAAVNQQTSTPQNLKGKKEKILSEFKIMNENGDLSVPKPLKKKGSQQKPKPPEEVQIEGSYLSWHAVRDAKIIGYRIYRIDKNGTIRHAGSISAYERKTFTDRESYRNSYYVTSIDRYGNESKPSKKAVPKSNF